MSESTPLTIEEPVDPPTRAVVVIQEAFGVNDHIEDVTRRFAAEGYLAVAPHLFHRSGDVTFAYDDIASARQEMARFTPEGIMADVDAALDHIDGRGVAMSSVGIVGFCMGGTVALVAGARRSLGAAVTFYGGGIASGRFGFPPLLEEVTRLRSPWLGLFGDRDAGIPVDEVEALRAAAATAPVPTEVVRYPDADHGFHCDARSSFHAPSAQDAWRRTLGWFDQHLATRSG